VDAESVGVLLASDVIHPAGDVNDYENAFFLPYWWYRGPILRGVGFPGIPDEQENEAASPSMNPTCMSGSAPAAR